MPNRGAGSGRSGLNKPQTNEADGATEVGCLAMALARNTRAVRSAVESYLLVKTLRTEAGRAHHSSACAVCTATGARLCLQQRSGKELDVQ